MVRAAAQKNHAAGHHLLGIDVRDLETEQLGIEPGRSLYVAYVEDDMAQLADTERVALQPPQLPHPVRIVHFLLHCPPPVNILSEITFSLSPQGHSSVEIFSC